MIQIAKVQYSFFFSFDNCCALFMHG
jgi:hypothetical protein